MLDHSLFANLPREIRSEALDAMRVRPLSGAHESTPGQRHLGAAVSAAINAPLSEPMRATAGKGVQWHQSCLQ